METDAPPLPPAPAGDPDERRWMTILHLSALAGLVLPSFGHVLGPLIIWLVKKNDFPAMDSAGKTVLNFQISWTLLAVLSGIAAVFGSCLIVPLALPVVLFLAWLYLVFKGAVRASNGESTNFPLTIKFLS